MLQVFENSEMLLEKEKKLFEEKGYFIIKGLLSGKEIELIDKANYDNPHLEKHKIVRSDLKGNESKLSLWNHPAENVYGYISRSRRIVDRAEELLGGEVYHWHTKMMLKEARLGGAWEWHQDYGYWYFNGCLTPDLVSCMISINHSTKENGCLQVLEGSHQMGRIEHGTVANQVGADMKRVEQALNKYKHTHVELEPGDGLFFHSNLLHTSSANQSDHPRVVMICCYNLKENSPYLPENESVHPHYKKLEKLEDDQVLLKSL